MSAFPLPVIEPCHQILHLILDVFVAVQQIVGFGQPVLDSQPRLQPRLMVIVERPVQVTRKLIGADDFAQRVHTHHFSLPGGKKEIGKAQRGSSGASNSGGRYLETVFPFGQQRSLLLPERVGLGQKDVVHFQNGDFPFFQRFQNGFDGVVGRPSRVDDDHEARLLRFGTGADGKKSFLIPFVMFFVKLRADLVVEAR